MIISVDFDDTYTKDPATWNKVIKLFQDAGHTVICVTLRPSIMGQQVLETIGKVIGEDKCIFAGGVWKSIAAENHGFKVDVWIDDLPNMIYRPDKGF